MLVSRYKIQSGFTLIELIIVIVIVGVIASLATINTSDNKQALLQTEAKRLQALFVLAQQEAVLQSRHLGLRFSQEGYQFYQMLDPKASFGDQINNTDTARTPQDQNQNQQETTNVQTPYQNNIEEEAEPTWQLLNDNILKPRQLPKVLVSQLYLDGISVELLSTQATEEVQDVNNIGTNTISNDANAQGNKPQIFLLSSGENTAFEYQLTYNNVGRVTIKVNPIGTFTLEYFYDKQQK